MEKTNGAHQVQNAPRPAKDAIMDDSSDESIPEKDIQVVHLRADSGNGKTQKSNSSMFFTAQLFYFITVGSFAEDDDLMSNGDKVYQPSADNPVVAAHPTANKNEKIILTFNATAWNWTRRK